MGTVDTPDPTQYGETFAAVYDDWYQDLGDVGRIVSDVNRRCRPPGALLELGAGTGRVAIPFDRAGWNVTALDSSPSMLALLRAKPDHAVTPWQGDAADDATWPSGPFEAIIAPFNFLLNLPGPAAQAACIQAAAERLTPGGLLAIEQDLLDLTTGSTSSPSDFVPGVWVRLETDADTGVVRGVHRGPDGTERSWTLHRLTIEDLDAMATNAGLTLDERTSGWGAPAWNPDDSRIVAWYQRPPR